MIDIETRGEVSILRMARGKGNSLNLQFMEALTQSFDELSRGPTRAVVLTGERSVFAAGVDLLAILEGGKAYLEAFMPALPAFFGHMVEFPKPLVAAVNGHAIAGGCVSTLACDYRLMARGKGKIGLTELLVGVPFPTWALEVVRFAVPRQHLQEVIYTGRTYTADEALARGLVDEVVELDALLDRACEVASQLGRIVPQTFRLTKRHLRMPLLERVKRYAPQFDPEVAKLWSNAEVLETMQAFVAEAIGRKTM